MSYKIIKKGRAKKKFIFECKTCSQKVLTNKYELMMGESYVKEIQGTVYIYCENCKNEVRSDTKIKSFEEL